MFLAARQRGATIGSIARSSEASWGAARIKTGESRYQLSRAVGGISRPLASTSERRGRAAGRRRASTGGMLRDLPLLEDMPPARGEADELPVAHRRRPHLPFRER